MRRVLAVVGAVLALAVITTGVVFALNYEGEDFCQDSPAWPGGTYLGQMHPHHSNFYHGYAERRGWDPCATWAMDQRRSAIRGLRELGFSVTEPSGDVPAPPASEPSSPPPVPAWNGPATTAWEYETYISNQVTEETGHIASVDQGGDSLVVRCSDDSELDVFVLFGSSAFISGNLDDKVQTVWRFDNGPVLSGEWNESISNESVFFPGSQDAQIEMVNRLLQANRFRIEATAWHDGEKFFADFSLDGSGDPNHPIRRTARGCGLGHLVDGGQNYQGEEFCRDAVAWPSGTYLGQMHPYHSDFYRGYAERRGWNPCTTWATDQRNSAIRGLRELGYTVTEPGTAPPAQAPAPQTTPEPTPTPIAQHPDYQRVYDEAVRRGATPEQASAIAASVVSRGTVDAFMSGNDSGVIFGDVSSPESSPPQSETSPDSPGASEVGMPGGYGVTCHSASWKRGSGLFPLKWQAKISNNGSTGRDVYIEVEWLDRDGFRDQWDNDIVFVQGNSSRTVTGETSNADGINSFRISDCSAFRN